MKSYGVTIQKNLSSSTFTWYYVFFYVLQREI